jgi:hypothetical protein
MPDDNQAVDFCDIPSEKLAALAQEATQNAVKELHSKGISTYGMRDGIVYETKPVVEERS